MEKKMNSMLVGAFENAESSRQPRIYLELLAF